MSKFVKKYAIILILCFTVMLAACTPSLVQEPTPTLQPTNLPTNLPVSSELQGVTWQLQSMDDVQLIAGSQITIRFTSNDAMEGSTGCRGYRGAYQVYGNSITFVTFNILGETDSCQNENLRAQETIFTDNLQLCTSYKVEEDNLELYTTDGQVLVFTAIADEE